MTAPEPTWSGLIAALICLDFAIAVAFLPAGVIAIVLLLLLA
jgi:hypothetical protein